MAYEGIKIGFAMTGSFCTFSKVIKELEKLKDKYDRRNLYGK